MQETITINQRVAVAADLTLQDAVVFAHFWSLRPDDPATFRWIDHHVWFPVTPESVVDALPLLNYKPETVRVSIRRLVTAGLLARRREDATTYYAVAELGRSW